MDFSQGIAIVTKSACPALPVTAALRSRTKAGVLLSELLMAGAMPVRAPTPFTFGKRRMFEMWLSYRCLKLPSYAFQKMF